MNHKRGNTNEPTKPIKEFMNSKKKLSQAENIVKTAILIDKISEINVNSAFLEVENRINKGNKIIQFYSQFSKYAAILILPLTFVIIWNLWLNKPTDYAGILTVQEINCPVGMRSQVSLPDGTKIWLNSESTIKYTLPFVRKTRKVELIGEAFLEVEPNKKSPFIIQSDNIKVNVVGTKFNFKSYPEDNNIEVTLKEGKINLNILDGSKKSNNIELKPSEHFNYNKKTIKASITTTEIEKFIRWRNNILVFENTPMSELEKTLERWYGVEITISDKEIEEYRFTTTFENESLHQVLELLELSSPTIRIDYKPGFYNAKTNELLKSKITITKKL